MTIISAPLPSLSSGAPAFFAAKPVFRPAEDGRPRTDSPAALVTTAFEGEQVLTALRSRLPAGTRLAITDGTALLAATDPAPEDGTSRDVTVGDRRWTVEVQDLRRTDYRAVWLVALVGAALLGTLAFVLLRGARYERRLRTATEAMGRLADLSHDLAAAARSLSASASRAEVGHVVQEQARTVVGALYANVAFVDPSDGMLVIGARSGLPDDVAQRYHRLPLDAGTPMTDAVVRNQAVWVNGPEEMLADYPAIVADADRLGFTALAALPLCDTAGSTVGALGLAWATRVPVDAALRSTVEIFADLTAQTFERVELVEQRLREGEVNRRLARVAELLATAGTTEEVVTTLGAGAAEAVGAASAAVGVVDATRGIVHVTEDESPEGRTSPLFRMPREPLADAVATRATVVVGGDPNGSGPVVAEPLLDHRRAPIGAIAVTFPPGVDLEAGGREPVRRLAGVAAQALERAVVTDGEHRRTSLLAGYATELSAARTVDQVIDVVVRAGGLPVDADEVAVGLVDESRELVNLHRRASADGSMSSVELTFEQALDPVREAVVTREPVLVSTAAEWRERYGVSDAAAFAPDVEAAASLPLRWADGARLGVVAVSWARPVTFDDPTRATLHLIARLAAQALQRAALHDIEHRVIADLQDRLMSDLPDVPGLDIAARYRAAGAGVEIGGDWFSVSPLGTGRLGLIVGDMTGHGISAVADMAQVRAMTAALLRAGLAVEEVADQASAFVADSASAVATALIAIIDVNEATLRCVVAGQVPPLLVLPDGTIEALEHGRRPVLGVPSAAARRPVVDHRPFPPGSILVAYTDGLIERRGELIDDGIARLRRAVLRSADAPPHELADRLLAELVGPEAGSTEDDVALVVVRAETVPPRPPDDRSSAKRVPPSLVTSPSP
jgi:serine phosphatase RsbU (regulator of sigma subunit)